MSESIMMVRHAVKDYGKWRPAFDADIGRQTAAGLSNPRVYRSADGGNDIVIKWDVEDEGRVRAFLASPDLAEKMKQAGVVDGPDVFFQKEP